MNPSTSLWPAGPVMTSDLAMRALQASQQASRIAS